MNKIMPFFSAYIFLYMAQLYSISLTEYVQQHGMPQVTQGSLNLSNKSLTDVDNLQKIIPEDMRNRVQRLYLNFNKLDTLPANIFSNFPNLQELYLNNNQLHTLLSQTFSNLRNLQQLNVSNNQLEILPKDIFSDLPNLKHLYLNNNKLQSINNKMLHPTTFNNLVQLKELHLNNNRLETLPGSLFKDLRSLQKLFLQNNQLRNLSETIFDNIPLKKLNLKGNAFSLDFIPKLTKMISAVRTLQTLNDKPKDQALQEIPFSTLTDLMLDTITQNIDAYRRLLHKLPTDLLELLPLTQKEIDEIEKKRAGQY